jgi:hypothetical protein
MPSQVILEADPNLGVVPDLDLQLVQTAWAWAARVADPAIQAKSTFMAGANVILKGWNEIDETPGVRANDVKRLDGGGAGPPQVNGSDGDRGVPVPSVGMAGDHDELPRQPVFGHRAQGSHGEKGVLLRFTPQRV